MDTTPSENMASPAVDDLFTCMQKQLAKDEVATIYRQLQPTDFYSFYEQFLRHNSLVEKYRCYYDEESCQLMLRAPTREQIQFLQIIQALIRGQKQSCIQHGEGSPFLELDAGQYPKRAFVQKHPLRVTTQDLVYARQISDTIFVPPQFLVEVCDDSEVETVKGHAQHLANAGCGALVFCLGAVKSFVIEWEPVESPDGTKHATPTTHYFRNPDRELYDFWLRIDIYYLATGTVPGHQVVLTSDQILRSLDPTENHPPNDHTQERSLPRGGSCWKCSAQNQQLDREYH